jgi:hypothetical protein
VVEVSELRCPQALSWVGPSEAVKVIGEDFFTGSVFVTDDSFVGGEGRAFRQRLSCSFRRHAMEATEAMGMASPEVAAALQPQCVWVQSCRHTVVWHGQAEGTDKCRSFVTHTRVDKGTTWTGDEWAERRKQDSKKRFERLSDQGMPLRSVA